MEDNRFMKVDKVKKSQLPVEVSWYGGKDYLIQDMLGLYASEVIYLKQFTSDAFELMQKATNKIIAENQLSYLGIPEFFHQTIKYSWENKEDNPFLIGRFDFSGGIDRLPARMIEFNADTCTMLPETITWQATQLKQLPVMREQHNQLRADLIDTLRKIRKNINFDDAFFLASSFGYQEDVINCNAVISSAIEAGFNGFYTDIKHVEFSEEDGIFYELGPGEFQPVDVWFKIVPWDWMFNEEPKLAKILARIIELKKCVVLNPPYTSIWQNKKFLAYIQEHFPNHIFAETFLSPTGLTSYVEKPIYGRIGENIKIVGEKNASSKGEYAQQEKIYQKYYPLATDNRGEYYQGGMFYSQVPSAINFRVQEHPIIGEDSEFISHFIL
ncbi:Glutathionylspermidine synthase preATP-grasp [Spirosomataceae bacterium TFI 002]|nr:Glutathionylspermidine synthase preATP-grasp [Spirosomataceae bacterium TFI 002]